MDIKATMFEQTNNNPDARIAFEPSVRRILADLACSVIKQGDAPCSSASHFDRAMTDLSALIANDLEGMPADIIEVIDASREHMAALGYLPPNDKG